MQSRLGRLPLIALLAAVLLAGCAQVPRQAFNAAAAAHVKRVVVTQQQNQDEYDTYVVGHPGHGFGLIGALVAAADMHAKTTQLTKAIDATETRLQARFGEQLAARLKGAGYDTQVVMLPKDAKVDEGLSLAKKQAGYDAVVLVELRGGYWAAGPNSDYFPRVFARVKVMDIKTEKVLYEDTIIYGYNMQDAEVVQLASDPTYRFKNIEDLVASPVKTREGLYAGIDAVTQQIVSDLRKQ